MRFDLHCHTTASDGLLSPAELVHRAAAQQVDVLAITDHDTLAGLDEARRTIATEQLPIKLVNGVEISTDWEHHEIHIVALGVDEKNRQLIEFLTHQQSRREARAVEIGRRLEKCLIPDTYQEAKLLAGDAAVTRAHFARVLVARKVADNEQKVFKKYLSRGNKGYVPADWPVMKEAIDVIHTAGGLAVLAHPSRYDLTTKWLKRLLVAFKAAGGDAMEVSLPQQSPQERANLGQWAKDHDLAISVGSDFHFPSNWTELGRHLWLPKEGIPLWLTYPEHVGLSREEHAALLAAH